MPHQSVSQQSAGSWPCRPRASQGGQLAGSALVLAGASTAGRLCGLKTLHASGGWQHNATGFPAGEHCNKSNTGAAAAAASAAGCWRAYQGMLLDGREARTIAGYSCQHRGRYQNTLPPRSSCSKFTEKFMPGDASKAGKPQCHGRPLGQAQFRSHTQIHA